MRQMARENQLLPHRAEHLRRERLIGDHEVQSTLVAERRTHHGFFVERRDHRAGGGFGDAGFGHLHPVFQRIKRAVELVAAQFVGIADAHAQRRIGLGDRHKLLVQGGHWRTRTARSAIRDLRDARRRHLARGERVVSFAHPLLGLVGIERNDRQVEFRW